MTVHYKLKVNLSDLAAKINTQLHKVVKWLQINQLSLNVSKSFFTVFSTVPKANLPVPSDNKFNLVHSPTTEFLGLLDDNKLNFSPHIRDVCTTVSRGIGLCTKLTLMMPFSVMRKLFLL